jgi:site-specific recombinase XerD
MSGPKDQAFPLGGGVHAQRYYGPRWHQNGGLANQGDGPMETTVAIGTLRTQEDMRHPQHIWTEPSNGQYPLAVLWDMYAEHLAGRSKPASPATIRKYQFTLLSFQRSLEVHGEPVVLSSVTPFAVERWIADCRCGRIPTRDRRHHGPRREDTIGTMLAAMKAFTHKYVFRHLEMTQRDLLERVERYEPTPPVKQGLTSDQLEIALGCYDASEYEDLRDRAMVAFYAASGLRFVEVLRLDITTVDPYSGWVKTVGKGNRERVVRVSERPLKYLRAYLRRRIALDECHELWTTRKGTALSYSGGQTMFRRLKRRSGIAIAHAHRFRHTWTQTALKKGAERALVQDAMGWTSDAMVRRYGGWVRSHTAAEAMPRFAPI